MSRYGLIGEKLGHSFSKAIHEDVGKYHYDLIELSNDDLSSFLMERNFNGLNVTIPYKEKVIPYLDELDVSAEIVGAVNTILNNKGKLVGYNTDMMGFIYQVKHMGLSLENEVVLILGSGGASKAVVAACQVMNAKKVLIASRSNSHGTISYEEIANHKDVTILVNATPVGMYPHNEDELLLSLDDLPNLKGVIDLIFNPLSTSLVVEAKKRGIKAEGGLYMLVGQAYQAINVFIDKPFDKADIEATYQKIKNEKDNIVLIGMPSSGKSAIAKLLAESLNMEIIDTDSEIESSQKCEIKEIFSRHGEDYFRDLETDVIKSIYKDNHKIISTGGGIIKKEININMLKQNGEIYFIDRDISNLTPTNSRPLSNDNDKLHKLYIERLPLYKKYADYVISNNSDIMDAVNEILKRRK